MDRAGERHVVVEGESSGSTIGAESFRGGMGMGLNSPPAVARGTIGEGMGSKWGSVRARTQVVRFQ